MSENRLYGNRSFLVFSFIPHMLVGEPKKQKGSGAIAEQEWLPNLLPRSKPGRLRLSNSTLPTASGLLHHARTRLKARCNRNASAAATPAWLPRAWHWRCIIASSGAKSRSPARSN
jgi:hypothetical protein